MQSHHTITDTNRTIIESDRSDGDDIENEFGGCKMDFWLGTITESSSDQF